MGTTSENCTTGTEEVDVEVLRVQSKEGVNTRRFYITRDMLPRYPRTTASTLGRLSSF